MFDNQYNKNPLTGFTSSVIQGSILESKTHIKFALIHVQFEFSFKLNIGSINFLVGLKIFVKIPPNMMNK